MSKAFEDLWALPWPRIVIVTGGLGVGKSTFTLSTGAAMERTFVVDFEMSQASFASQLTFRYVDVPSLMQKRHPGGYWPLDIYQEVNREINAVPDGEYDILVLDNASIFEDGHVNYVEKFPKEFGLSQLQLDKSGGLKWGAVKNLYLANLTRYASKFKIVFVVVHLRDKWVGNNVVKDEYGQAVQEPKGKETLELLASLFVWLEHGPGGIPSARVLKCRIDRKVYVADPQVPPDSIPQRFLDTLGGEPGIVSIPVLPLRLPQCTWPAIRAYMRQPADLLHPAPGEAPSQKVLGEDDRLRLRSIIAQNEATVAEGARLKAEQDEKKALEGHKKAFIAKAASLGYKTAKGQPDVEAIIAVLSPLSLYPYDPAREREALEALEKARKDAA